MPDGEDEGDSVDKTSSDEEFFDEGYEARAASEPEEQQTKKPQPTVFVDKRKVLLKAKTKHSKMEAPQSEDPKVTFRQTDSVNLVCQFFGY